MWKEIGCGLLGGVLLSAPVLSLSNAGNEAAINKLKNEHSIEIETMQAALDESESNLNSYRLLTAQQALELEEKEISLNNKQSELDKANSDLAEEKENNRTLTNNVTTLENTIAEKETAIADLQTELQTNKELSEQQKIDYENQITTIQSELDTTKAELITTKESLEESNTQKANLQAQVATLTSERDELQVEVDELKAEIESLKVEIDSLEYLLENQQSSPADFTIEGNTITKYNGSDNFVIIPSSYSLSEPETITETFSSKNEFMQYVSDNNRYNFTLTCDSTGKTFTATSKENYTSQSTTANMFFMMNSAPYTATFTVQHLVAGDDFEITTIASYAFQGSNAQKVILRDNITTLETGAFRGFTNLKSIVLSNSLTSIPNDVFTFCTNLDNVVIPDNVTTIGSSVFYGCESLKTIKIPNHIIFSSNAFQGTNTFIDNVEYETSGEGYTFKNGTLTITTGGELVANWKNFNALISEVVFADGIDPITTIPDSAFYYSNLKSISIPDTVTNIGKSAFCSSKFLETITISTPLENLTIGEEAFQFLDNLVNVTATATGENYTFVNGALTVTSDGEVINNWSLFNGLITSVNFTGNVTSLGTSAFKCCSAIKSVTIPSTVTTISEKSFYFCSNLETVILSDGLEDIGISAFSYCKKLVNIQLPNTLKTIGQQAFEACAFTSITIPAKVTTINSKAFQYVKDLEIRILSEVPPTLASTDFVSVNYLKAIYIPAGTKSLYEADENWSTFIDKIVELPTEEISEG